MSKEDIERAQKDAEAHASEDKKKKEAVEVRNQLENSIYQAEKMPDEYKDKISDEDKETIKSAVEDAKKVLNDSDADKDALETAAKELSDKIMPIGAKMYQEASKDAGAASDGKSEDSSKSSDDEPVEGEVVDK